jgi:hypothetical protein
MAKRVPTMKLAVLLTISVLLPAAPRTDDRDTASLGGRVTDENKAPIASAKVSIRNKFSGEVQIVKSDGAGFYRIAALRPGRYSVFAQAESYGCTWVLNVFLFRGKDTNLDLVLTDSLKKRSSANCAEVIRSAQ